MSSSDDHGILVRALDRGADDFLRKPPITEELRARLRAADRLTSMQQELIRYATTDFLTGLFNRREFFHRATEAIGEVPRGATLSAVMFDIDHFKRVNDRYGHEAGDRALTAIASVVKGFDGISGRLGGEEFCLLARHGQARAMEIAEDPEARDKRCQIQNRLQGHRGDLQPRSNRRAIPSTRFSSRPTWLCI
jgi:diguanylate cyclase (GGDEF)-like protein